MVRKAVASLLLVLAASPFTAPFATCDVLTLLGERTTAAQEQYQTPGASLDDASQAVAMASAFRRNRIRHKFGASTPAIPSVTDLRTARSLSLGNADHLATSPAISRTPLIPLRT